MSCVGRNGKGKVPSVGPQTPKRPRANDVDADSVNQRDESADDADDDHSATTIAVPSYRLLGHIPGGTPHPTYRGECDTCGNIYNRIAPVPNSGGEFSCLTCYKLLLLAEFISFENRTEDDWNYLNNILDAALQVARRANPRKTVWLLEAENDPVQPDGTNEA